MQCLWGSASLLHFKSKHTNYRKIKSGWGDYFWWGKDQRRWMKGKLNWDWDVQRLKCQPCRDTTLEEHGEGGMGLVLHWEFASEVPKKENSVSWKVLNTNSCSARCPSGEAWPVNIKTSFVWMGWLKCYRPSAVSHVFVNIIAGESKPNWQQAPKNRVKKGRLSLVSMQESVSMWREMCPENPPDPAIISCS